MIKSFWEALGEKLGRAARGGLMVGVVVVLLFMGLGTYWLLRSDYQPLFTDLSPQDTATMTAELERQKIPYVLSDQGNNVAAIMVDKSEVYKTRIKLMGKDIPLHGTVGFELFNNSDFGMTEFAQKINYQRALQGELTRTILSLSEIRDARVLLALPEQGLFKQATNKPKASVTVSMKDGQRLRQEQVAGIQRLVSSAVPGILAEDVTIVDQNGIALTRVSDGEGEYSAGGGSNRLDLKKETETYLSHKAMEVLERALGPGQAMASVDVTLDMDRVQSNTDEVLSAPGNADGAPTGVVVRERQTTREMEAPLNAHGGADAAPASPGGSNQSEFEYAVGHHVEQVISQPGSIRRIQVAVVVHKALNASQQEQLRTMVAACIGASPDRGDSVVVQTLDGLAAPVTAGNAEEAPQRPAAENALPEPAPPALRATVPWSSKIRPQSAVALFALLMLVGVAAFMVLPRSTPGRRKSPSLTVAERQAALAQIQTWMQAHPDQADPSGTAGGGISGGAA
ncbi:MAG TPA: flagellar basal-body MS-ring/collar protein FliF [Geothrix sp.]|nr:flagellar basal-body MS-ring/collar protein FliF [Geothrix sp.]